MSYAFECMARGKTMFNDTLQGVRERHARRWVLLLPVTLVALVFTAFIAIPWLFIEEDGGGAIALFIIWYSTTAAAAIVAPTGKPGVAALVALFGNGYNIWGLWLPPDPDPDALSPWMCLAGTTVGGGVAVALSFWHVRSIWLLLVPAYFIGWCVAPALAVPVIGLICALAHFDGPPLGPSLAATVFACAVGVLIASHTAPSHRGRVAIAFLLLSVGLMVYAIPRMLYGI